MENPIEVQPPGSDRLLLALCMVTSRDRIPFTPLDNVPLDLVHSPTIESSVNESHGVCIASSTYVVNCSIALRTG